MDVPKLDHLFYLGFDNPILAGWVEEIYQICAKANDIVQAGLPKFRCILIWLFFLCSMTLLLIPVPAKYPKLFLVLYGLAAFCFFVHIILIIRHCTHNVGKGIQKKLNKYFMQINREKYQAKGLNFISGEKGAWFEIHVDGGEYQASQPLATPGNPNGYPGMAPLAGAGIFPYQPEQNVGVNPYQTMGVSPYMKRLIDTHGHGSLQPQVVRGAVYAQMGRNGAGAQRVGSDYAKHGQ